MSGAENDISAENIPTAEITPMSHSSGYTKKGTHTAYDNCVLCSGWECWVVVEYVVVVVPGVAPSGRGDAVVGHPLMRRLGARRRCV